MSRISATLGTSVVLLGLILMAIIIYIFHALGVTVLQSDPLMYLEQSKHWWVRDLHLPGYGFVVWCVDAISLHQLPPTFLLHLVAILTWIASTLSFARILQVLRLDSDNQRALLFSYAFFPCLGLTFAAWPVADSAVWLVVNLLVLACLTKDWKLMIGALAVGLVLHKVVWGFCLLIALYACVSLRFSPLVVVFGGLPLFVFWLAIVWQGADLMWMVDHDLERHFPSYSKLPILDGVLGTLFHGGARNFGKGLILLAIFVFEVVVFIKALKAKNWLAAAILIPLIVLGATVNQWLGIAVLRFGKISLLSMALLVGVNNVRIPKWFTSRLGTTIVLVFLLCTQLFYAVYMKSFFEAGGVLDERLGEEKAVFESKGIPTYNKDTNVTLPTP